MPKGKYKTKSRATKSRAKTKKKGSKKVRVGSFGMTGVGARK
jgi:hypothetical protein